MRRDLKPSIKSTIDERRTLQTMLSIELLEAHPSLIAFTQNHSTKTVFKTARTLKTTPLTRPLNTVFIVAHFHLYQSVNC